MDDDKNEPKWLANNKSTNEHIPISPNGHKLAQTVGAWLAKRQPKFDVVLCSPARRCIETAHHLATALGHVPYELHDGFTEQLIKRFYDRQPDYQLTRATFATEFPLARTTNFKVTVQFPETDSQSHARYQKVIRDIALAHSGKTILIVTHGNGLNAAAGLRSSNTIMFEGEYCCTLHMTCDATAKHWAIERHDGPVQPQFMELTDD